MTLAPELEALLAPQVRFDELRRRSVLRAGAGLADLAYANSYGGPSPLVLHALHRALDDAGELDLQYTPYGGTTITRRLVAQELSKTVGLTFGHRSVVMTPGAMAALNVVLRALKERGDGEIIVPIPCWLDYPLYARNLGLDVRFVPVRPDTLRLDLGAIEEALGPRTLAVLLMQPVNPSGLLHTAEELDALAKVLGQASRPPLVISDETHRGIRFQTQPFVSPALHWPNTCIVHSFGKSLQIQGQRIGYVAVSPSMPEGAEFASTLEKLCRVMGFCTPTSLMQLAIRELVTHAPDWSALATRRRTMLEALRAGGYEVVPSEATYFLYPRTPGGSDDWAHAERLAHEGLLVLPAPVLHHRGHFRIAMTCTDAMLDKACNVLGEVVRA
ncbi:MAG TPA: aminotransferase class I/II-fold pyridoxal phosphate-dependent enzyme [Planctomycetota bacterium]|nr:aminotransferase class I/II-fold pyridoxal phosphate-dependent enzyme [Planctomycetota bacterium]